MKKSIIVIVVSIFAVSGVYAHTETFKDVNFQEYAGNAQEYEINTIDYNGELGIFRQRKGVVKLVVGTGLGVAYERVLIRKFSIEVKPYIAFYSVSRYNYSILGITITPRLYLNKRKYTLEGWYLGLPFDTGPVLGDVVGFNTGLRIGMGYQWVFPVGFALDLFSSVGVAYATASVNVGDILAITPSFSAGISIGYAF